MTYQRWTIHTTDDRDGAGNGTYVVEGVTSAVEIDDVLRLAGDAGPIGAFPLDNVMSKSFEEYTL